MTTGKKLGLTLVVWLVTSFISLVGISIFYAQIPMVVRLFLVPLVCFGLPLVVALSFVTYLTKKEKTDTDTDTDT